VHDNHATGEAGCAILLGPALAPTSAAACCKSRSYVLIMLKHGNMLIMYMHCVHRTAAVQLGSAPLAAVAMVQLLQVTAADMRCSRNHKRCQWLQYSLWLRQTLAVICACKGTHTHRQASNNVATPSNYTCAQALLHWMLQQQPNT
jgi:hypothetical protein